MKEYIVIAFILSSITLSSNELSWVDTQVQAIKPARKGMSDTEINKIKDPFIFYKNRSQKSYAKVRRKSIKHANIKNSATSSDAKSIILQQPLKPLILSAIINDSALINGNWYKLNESVDSFKLSSIKRTSVVLRKGNGKLILTTSDTNRNLKFK